MKDRTPNSSPSPVQPQPQPSTSAIMTKEYQDLQHLDNEESDHHQLRRGPPAPQPLLRRLCSGPRLLLLSLGLSLLLLVVVCVIGSQSGCPGVGSEGSNSERGQVVRLSSVIGSHQCPLLPRLPAAGGAAGPARDPEQLHLEHWGRSHGTELQGRQCGEKDEIAGIRGGETAAGPEGRSLQPTAPREAVRVRPPQPKLSDGCSPGQWLSGHLLPRELGGARGQLLLVLSHGEALARGGQVLPAGERAPGGGHVPGGAEIYRAPHRFSEHLDGPLRPRRGLEVGGRHRLRGRLPELETRPAGRLVGARAGRRGGLRPLHQRRPLERRYVPATLPLGLRDEAGPGCLGAPSLLIYFLGASTCRGGRGSSLSWGRPSRILRAVEEDLTPPRALSVVGRLLSPTLIF